MNFKLKSFAAAAVLGLSSLAANAVTLLDFTVAEGSVPGAAANTFVADKINGGYSEILTVNPDFSFTTTAIADFGQFFRNDGATLVAPTQLNGFNGYAIYAVFTSVGQFVSGNTFVGGAGSFELFIDPNQDTIKTLGANGSAPVGFASNADDYKIAGSNTLVSGLGLVGNPGAFDLVFENFMLTAAGSSYFIAPNPFHMVVNVDGDFDNFVPAPGSFTVVGDVSAVFEVPEPGSLALLGLALAGVGVVQRRRNKSV